MTTPLPPDPSALRAQCTTPAAAAPRVNGTGADAPRRLAAALLLPLAAAPLPLAAAGHQVCRDVLPHRPDHSLTVARRLSPSSAVSHLLPPSLRYYLTGLTNVVELVKCHPGLCHHEPVGMHAYICASPPHVYGTCIACMQVPPGAVPPRARRHARREPLDPLLDLGGARGAPRLRDPPHLIAS